MKKIIYVSRAGLPIDAPGIRIKQIGNLLENMGYQIHYICNRRIGHDEKFSGFDKAVSTSELRLNQDEIHFQHGNKVYSYLRPFSGGKINALREIIEIITAERAYRRIKSYCIQEKPAVIILYNDVYGLTKKLITFCKKNHIRLIADVTEWYEKRENASLGEKLVIRLTNRRIQKLDKKLDGIIAVSRFLEEYYHGQGANCIWIPPLMDINPSFQPKKYEYDGMNHLINFVYAGSPGSKDILKSFVEALVDANRANRRFRLDVIGIDEDYLMKNGMGESLHTGVYAHGRMSHEQTIEYIRHADFGILFRKNERYAKAGFSTKFAECMSCGVPMMCNSVGGTDTLIRDGENGILTQSYDKHELSEALERISRMDEKKLLSMKATAYADACQYFSSENSRDKLKELVSN